MRLRAVRHLNDEQLELYSLGRLPEDHLPGLEEHLLICEECQKRLEETDSYVAAMRSAAAQIDRAPQKSPWFSQLFLRPVWAFALVGALAAAFFVWNSQGPSLAPVAVALQAVRGPSVAVEAPAGRPLTLVPDLTGVASFPSYRLEIVDPTGRQVWTAVSTSGARADVKSLKRGSYFVRAYSPAGELLREYGLVVR